MISDILSSSGQSVLTSELAVECASLHLLQSCRLTRQQAHTQKCARARAVSSCVPKLPSRIHTVDCSMTPSRCVNSPFITTWFVTITVLCLWAPARTRERERERGREREREREPGREREREPLIWTCSTLWLPCTTPIKSFSCICCMKWTCYVVCCSVLQPSAVCRGRVPMLVHCWHTCTNTFWIYLTSRCWHAVPSSRKIRCWHTENPWPQKGGKGEEVSIERERKRSKHCVAGKETWKKLESLEHVKHLESHRGGW